MSGQPRFYQIAGFRGHTDGWFRWDERALADAVFRTLEGKETGRLELILGILDSGTSYLLVTPAEMERLERETRERPLRGRDPHPLSDYLSLSPIVFDSGALLLKKLKSYARSAKASRKRNSRLNEVPRDTSQANKTYALGGHSTRYAFEHQRVLFRALMGNLDCDRFCIAPGGSFDKAVIISFNASLWLVDGRSKAQILADPKVIHVSWSAVVAERLRVAENSARVHTAEHEYVVEENSMLQNKRSGNRPSDRAETKTKAAISEALKQTLQSHSSALVLFLVHDQTTSMAVLKSLGIHCDAWADGIGELLNRREFLRQYQSRYNQHRGDAYHNPRYNNDRNWGNAQYNRYSERDRSPRRDASPRRVASGSSAPLPPRDEGLRSIPGTFVVDVQKLHQELFAGQPFPLERIVTDLSADTNISPSTMFHLWQSMASGESIDEQRARRVEDRVKLKATDRQHGGVTGAQQGTNAAIESDSDVDPNDVTATAPSDRWKSTMYDTGSEDEYDYD